MDLEAGSKVEVVLLRSMLNIIDTEKDVKEVLVISKMLKRSS